MGSWTRDSETWLEEPREEIRQATPLLERGKQFLNSWVDCYFDDRDKTKLTVSIGYATDVETHEHLGAMLSVSFNDGEQIQFTTREMAVVVEFLRSHYDKLDDPLSKTQDYIDDVHGLIESLENAMEQAKIFEKGAARH